MNPIVLTDKQRQVLQLASDGYTYADMAQELRRSRFTIIKHSRKAMEVLGADNLVQAIAMCLRRGIIK